ncbi:MAG: heme A synthase [Alphaproteobacteria bacterium]|nr:heme A synthase [Alphaproteobacteria bacterium]
MTLSASTLASAPSATDDRKAVAWWLILCAVLVLIMVMIGGYTRLTQSGLSIVEWKPVTGFIPPIGEAAWQAEFDKYKQYPEFQKVNRDMTLDGFKAIFWVEFWHRVIGRLIGLAYAVPFFVFLLRRRIGATLGWQLTGLFGLGLFQGVLGWWMVASGLVDKPDVSHYRLTIHLGVAILIFIAMVWMALGLLAPRGAPREGAGGAIAICALSFYQILSGGLVAGLDAGFGWNTWPKMMDEWVPEQWLDLEPWWLNFFENTATIQFSHRMTAYLLTVAVFWFAWRHRQVAGARRAILYLVLATSVQIGLGIATLLTLVDIPIAVAHQGWALVVMAAGLYAAHVFRRP